MKRDFEEKRAMLKDYYECCDRAELLQQQIQEAESDIVALGRYIESADLPESVENVLCKSSNELTAAKLKLELEWLYVEIRIKEFELKELSGE